MDRNRRRGLLGAALDDLVVFDDLCWESAAKKDSLKKRGRRAQDTGEAKPVGQRKRKNGTELGAKIRGKDRGISNRRACKM